MIVENWLGSDSSVRAIAPIPAEFTSTCGRPRSLATASTAASTEAASLTSTVYAAAVAPAPSSSLATVSAASVARSSTATFAPSLAKQLRRRTPEAGASSGDDRDSIRETRHVTRPPWPRVLVMDRRGPGCGI